MADLLSTIASYLSSIAQPQTSAGPPSPGTAPAAGQPGGAAGPSMLSNIATGTSNFLSSPLAQAGLSGYFNAIGSPRLAGLGGKISAGGLGALQGFNAAEAGQTKTAEEQLAMQKAQAEVQAAQQKQTAIGQLPANVRPYVQAGATDLYKDQQTTQDTMLTNQQNGQILAVMADQMTDPKRKAIYQGMAVSVPKMTGKTDLDSLIKAGQSANDLDEALKNSQIGLNQARTSEAKAGTTKDTAEANAAGMSKGVANWLDSTTGEQYRGTQRKPTDKLWSPSETPKPVDPLKQASEKTDMREKFGKEYDESLSMYAKHTMSTADYQKGKEDYIGGKMAEMGLGGPTPASSTAKPAAASGDPLSLVPPGATVGMKDGVHGYTTSDGVFHSVE